MGRKKKKQLKPWCWYCNREFDDEKILIQHQKSKHFKCTFCHKKLYTGPGLSIHAMQVHKEKIDKIPFALPHRSNVDIEIYGMEGIPDDDLKDHEKHKLGKEEEPEEKKPRLDPLPGQPYPLPGLPIAPAIPCLPPLTLPVMPPPIQIGLGPPPILVTRPTIHVPGVIPALNHIVNSIPVPSSFVTAQPTALLTQNLMPPQLPIKEETLLNASHIPPPPPPPPMPTETIQPQINSVTPTFPAYSGNIENKVIQKVARPTSSTPNIKVVLVHPEDDIPLEQIRLRLDKYAIYLKGGGGTQSNGSDKIPPPPPPMIPNDICHIQRNLNQRQWIPTNQSIPGRPATYGGYGY